MNKASWTGILFLLLIIGCSNGCNRDVSSPKGSNYKTGQNITILGPDIALSSRIQDRFSRMRGAAPADYDLDGDMDVFLSSTGDFSRIFWNKGVDSNGDVVFQEGPVLLKSARAYFTAAADYDNDGDPDLFVGIGGVDTIGFDHLFENVSGKFIDVTDVAKVGGPVDDSNQTIPTATSGGAWGDYDNDGWLDLYVTTQVVKETLPQLAGRNILYRNMGDGTFEDVTDTAGVGDTRSSWIPSWFDGSAGGVRSLILTFLFHM